MATPAPSHPRALRDGSVIGVGTRGPGGPEMLTLAEYPDPVPGPECTRDTECDTGQICQIASCVLPAKLDCAEGGDAAAVLTTRPAPLDFGPVGSEALV